MDYLTNTEGEPITPGIYVYDNSFHNVAFALDKTGQWWVWFNGVGVDKCVWEYIEQALDVWGLVLIEGAP